MQRFGQGSPYLRIKGILTTPEGKAAWNVLQKFPASDVHLYLFGPDGIYQNGYQPGNYFDSAGTQLASVDGSVGAVLDAAGARLPVSTGATDGWLANNATLSSSNGVMTVTNTLASSPFAHRAIQCVIGQRYLISVTLTRGTTPNNNQLRVGDSPGGVERFLTTALATSGTYPVEFVATQTTHYLAMGFGETAVGQTSLWKINFAVAGIHATQGTPGFKPTLRKGIVNLLTYSNDLTNAVWATQGTGVKTSPVFSFPAIGDRGANNTNALPSGNCTLALVLSGSGTCDIWGYNATNGNIGITQFALTATPTLYVVPISPTVEGTQMFFGRNATQGNATATSVTVGAGGYFQGTLTAQQILAAGGIPLTTTAPASSVAGVNYLEFKAANSTVLQLPSPAFQMADDHFVVASANFYGGGPALNKVIYSPAADSTPWSIKRLGQIAYDLGSVRIQGSWYDGTNYDELHFAWPVGVPFVAATRKVGSVLELWVNGVLRMTKTATATAFTANCGSIGAYPTSGAASYFDGAVYYADAIKGTVSNADLLLQCKQAAAAAGIQL